MTDNNKTEQKLHISDNGDIKFNGTFTPDIVELIQQQLHQSEFLKNKVLELEKQKLERESRLDFVYVIAGGVGLFMLFLISYFFVSSVSSYFQSSQVNQLNQQNQIVRTK
jgi:hypothetical protein